VIPGRANKWFGPQRRREEQRAALEREATRLLAEDRRKNKKSPWLPLKDLRSALRERRDV